MKKKPQVEIVGWEARNYDNFLNFISFGQYQSFIYKAIENLDIREDEIIMDLGAGTGKNEEIMLQYMGTQGKIYALEIGEEMREQLNKRQMKDSRIHIINQRIEQSFQLPEKASLAFISFVLHGLEQSNRLRVIENIANNLRDSGRFCILDYNHFAVQDSPWYVKFAIRKVECETTEDFISRDWEEILTSCGFENFSSKLFFRNYLRLICCHKK